MISVSGPDHEGDDVAFVEGEIFEGAEGQEFCAFGDAFCEGFVRGSASQFDVPSDAVPAFGVCVADVTRNGELALGRALPCDDRGPFWRGVGSDTVGAHGAGDADGGVRRVRENAESVGAGPSLDEVVIGGAVEFSGEEGFQLGGAVAEVVSPSEEMLFWGVGAACCDGVEALHAGFDEGGA